MAAVGRERLLDLPRFPDHFELEAQRRLAGEFPAALVGLTAADEGAEAARFEHKTAAIVDERHVARVKFEGNRARFARCLGREIGHVIGCTARIGSGSPRDATCSSARTAVAKRRGSRKAANELDALPAFVLHVVSAGVYVRGYVVAVPASSEAQSESLMQRSAAVWQ